MEALSQAATTIAELPASGLKAYALNNLAERWAYMDPNEALKWINAQENDGAKRLLMNHSREGLLTHSPEKVWGMLDEEGSVEGRISLMVPYMQSRASKIGYEETVEWIKNLPRRYAATSPALLATAYSDWARSSPVEVAQSIKDVGRLEPDLDARVWRTVLRSVDYRDRSEEIVLVSEIFRSLDPNRRIAIKEFIDGGDTKFREKGVVDMLE